MNTKKKHILIISPFATPNIGGVESHLDQLIEVAVRENYFVTLVTYQPLTTRSNWEPYYKGDNYEILRARWFGIGFFPIVEKFFPASFLYLFPGLFIKSLKYFAKNYNNIDTIHAHGLAAATIARILKMFHKVNIVLSTHAIYSFEKRKFLGYVVRKILQDFDYLLGVSAVSAAELVALGLPKEIIGVHKNWVDVNKFIPRDKLASRAALKMSSGLHILFVGRLIDLKGVRLFCETAVNVPDITFHIAGQGPLDSYVKDMADENSNIIFYGVIMQNEKEGLDKLTNLYSACDFLLSPYLYDEGFSIVLIESLCSGTPVIVPDRGSPPTFLPRDNTIFLSREPSVVELTDVLRGLRSRYKKMKDWGKICRRHAVENFSDKNAFLILDHY